METTITKEKDGIKVKVTIDRGVNNNNAYADGWNVDLGKKTYEYFEIWIEKGGKKAFCRDLNFVHKITDRDSYKSVIERMPQAYGRFGDTYVSKEVYTVTMETIDEAKKVATEREDEEYTAVMADEKDKQAKDAKQAIKNAADHKEDADSKIANGFCFACQSYCYGDCGNYQTSPNYGAAKDFGDAMRE